MSNPIRIEDPSKIPKEVLALFNDPTKTIVITIDEFSIPDVRVNHQDNIPDIGALMASGLMVILYQRLD